MGILDSIAHPSELIALAQFAINQPLQTDYSTKSPSYRLCYELLNKTSRSFARVIQALDEELKHPIAIFYLVLRGLDTIEDDMTIPIKRKVDLLQSFHELTIQKGWNFHESGENEKDAILLREYHHVIEELLNLKPIYLEHIIDITKRMGYGMAEFCGGKQVVTMEDYNLYTHYVAGLVGVGLTNIFVASGFENPSLADNMELSNQMGLFLQKVNILKDFTGDITEGRLFWPKDVWKVYVSPGAGPEDLKKPENRLKALACLNHLCADALDLVPYTLDYLSQLKNPSVFQFAAIPQVMALATFCLFYNNYALFEQKGTKIRRGLAVQLMLKATDMENLKQIYLEHAHEISRQSRRALGTNPHDKSFQQLSLACANISKWILVDNQKQPKVVARSNGSSLYYYAFLMLGLVLAMSFLPVVQ